MTSWISFLSPSRNLFMQHFGGAVVLSFHDVVCGYIYIWDRCIPQFPHVSPASRLFGIIARRVAACDCLQTPQDVCDTMVQELNRPALKGWVGLNTQVSAQKLEAVRSWKGHFGGPQKVSLQGGLLEDSTSNHCFVFLLRRGQARVLQQSFKVVKGLFLNAVIVLLSLQCLIFNHYDEIIIAIFKKSSSACLEPPLYQTCQREHKSMWIKEVSKQPLLHMIAFAW